MQSGSSNQNIEDDNLDLDNSAIAKVNEARHVKLPPNCNKQQQQDSRDKKPVDSQHSITIADIIGEFGWYQFSLASITFIRYVCVALMTNAGPLFAPSVQFWCKLPDELDNNKSWNNLIVKPENISKDDFLANKCQMDLRNGSSFECTQYIYNRTEYGVTLTDSFNLVCQRDWLRSVFQSTISFGVVFASIAWGSFSDKHGRSFAVHVSFVGALLSGLISYFADSMLLFTISRSICSFCELGLVVSLLTIIVEISGNKYRGSTCIIVYTGWAVGVAIMPWIAEYFRDYRQAMVFTIFLNLATLPWLLTVKESVRWSLVNGRISEAGEEIKRISKWNSKGDNESLAEGYKKFDQFKKKYVRIAEKKKDLKEKEGEKEENYFYKIFESMFGGLSKVEQLIKSKESITTLALIWTTFNCELLYMFTILINNDIGDKFLNYLIGAGMELLATLISILMISKMTRRLSLVTTLIAISALCLTLSLTHNDLIATTVFLNLTKLAISTLSSIIMVVTTEIFPTNLRQTGIGVAATLGSLGAVVAPFVRTELADQIGMSRVLLIFVILPLTAAIIIPFFLRETGGLDLPDDIDELDDFQEEHKNEDKNGDCNRSKDSLGMKKISVITAITVA